jgi:hypothetical protein
MRPPEPAAPRSARRAPSPGRRHAGPPPGIALLITLFAILVLEVIAAGTFHVAIQQVRTARAAGRTLQLQLAAQAAVALALAGWNADSAAALPLDSTRVLPTETTADGIQRTVTLRRVAHALYLLRGEAGSALGEHVAVAAIVRTAGPADYLASIRAGVDVGAAVTGTGTVSGRPAESCGDTAGIAAGPALAVTDSSRLPAGGLALDGAILVAPSSAALEHPAGVDLAALAVPRAPGVIAPAAQGVAGVCMAGLPDNWGAPDDEAHPCATHFPVVRIAGDVSVTAGSGQGVLIVEGDAVLGPDVAFHGLLLVRGSLTLHSGAAVFGAARVGSDLGLDAATIRFEPCAIARAVHHGPGLRGPFRAADHWWLPM